jgi:DNA-binding Lrp family transcriptional regulator
VIFDELDRTLLKELQNNARQTNVELATTVGMPTGIVAERVRALVERGVILGYHAEINLSATGRRVQALVSVRVRTSAEYAVRDFRTWVEARPEMVNLFVTSGSSDFVLHVAVPGTDDLYSFVMDHLVTQPTVLEVVTSLVFDHVRHRMAEPVAGVHRHRKLVPAPPQYSA